MKEVNAHKMVADLCVEMAQDVYEECATRYNTWFLVHPDRAAFVKECAPTLRQYARQTLANLLERDDVDEYDKNMIFEALLLDSTIPQTGVWDAPRSRLIH